MKRILFVVAAALCLLYAGDWVSVRYRSEPFGAVQVRRYYAIPQKDGRTQFTFDKPENQSCVQSLFPHLGLTPCWYLRRHPVQRIDF
jgi:hypothetical protein